MNEEKTQSPFRRKSLERLSSPEQLDELIQIIPGKSWWWIGSLGFVVFTILIWSIFGRIPLTVNGKGIMVYPSRVTLIQSTTSGTLNELKVNVGSVVKKGQIIAVIDQPELDQKLSQDKSNLERLKNQFNRENMIKKLNDKDLKDSLNLKMLTYEKEIKESSYYGKLIKDQNNDALTNQRISYQKQINSLSNLNPIFISSNLKALKAQKQSLHEQLDNANIILKNLNTIYANQKELRKKQLITVSIILQTQQQIYQTLDKISSIQSQFKELDSQIINLQKNEFDNQNKIESLRAQIQSTGIDQNKLQEMYLQNQQNINKLRTQLVDLKSQETAIDLDNQMTKGQQTSQLASLQQEIQQLELRLSEQKYIKSQYDATVWSLAVLPGQLIQPGQDIVRILRNDIQDQLQCIAFLTIADGKKVTSGMKAQVTPSSVSRNDYGGILGTVHFVSPYPEKVEAAARYIGDEKIAELLTANSQNVAVHIELDKDPNTFSGYKWSSRSGPNIQITQGTTVGLEIITEERAPITFVIPLLKSLTGLK